MIQQLKYLAKNDISPSISASGNNIKISVGGKYNYSILFSNTTPVILAS